MARYEPENITDIRETPGGQTFAAGTLIVMEANPSPCGPNRIPVARYRGRVVRSFGRDPWLPLDGTFEPWGSAPTGNGGPTCPDY